MTSIRLMAAIVCAIALGLAASVSAQPFEEGTHFERIDGPDVADADGEIEVVEFFSYMCPHCYTFEPYVEPWHDELGEDVEFRRVPVIFNRSWEPFARAYYTAEVLNILDQSHMRLFAALHDERQPLRSLSDLAEFHAQFGVEASKFESTAASFPVESKVRMGNAAMGKWGVRSTPSLVINGKYRVSPRAGGGFDEMLEVADYLIARELENSAPAAAE